MLMTPIISHIFQSVVLTGEETIVGTAPMKKTSTIHQQPQRRQFRTLPQASALCITVCVYSVMYFIVS